MANKQKVGGNSRKKGRMLAWCLSYRNRQQAEHNRARKLAKHLRKTPWDADARRAFEALPDSCKRGNPIPAVSVSPAAVRAMNGTTLTKMKRGVTMAAA